MPAKDQELTNSINNFGDQNDPSEEQKTTAETGELSDFLVSTGSGDESQAGRKYKIVGSALDFQRIVQEYITLSRSFENLASDAALKLLELI